MTAICTESEESQGSPRRGRTEGRSKWKEGQRPPNAGAGLSGTQSRRPLQWARAGLLSQGAARSLIRANCHPDRLSAGTDVLLPEREARRETRPSLPALGARPASREVARAQRAPPRARSGLGFPVRRSASRRPRGPGSGPEEDTWGTGEPASTLRSTPPGRSVCQRQGRDQPHQARSHRHLEVKNSDFFFVIRIHTDAKWGAISHE